MPKVSIIVPIYNVEAYLVTCIEGLLCQTFQDIEILLVDDGSTDGGSKICEAYSKRDNRIRLIKLPMNQGVSAARNIGISKACGDYIGFVDPDDKIHPKMYEVLYNNAILTGVEMVVCRTETRYQKQGKIISSTINSPWKICGEAILSERIQKELMPDLLTKGYFGLLMCTNKLYKRDIFDRYKLLFDEKKNHGEDARFNLRLLTKIQSIEFVDEVLYYYSITERPSLTRIFREDLYDYIVDNKNFGIELCNRYHVQEKKAGIISTFMRDTLAYMESVVSANIGFKRKYKLIKSIMKHHELKEQIKGYKSPTLYHKVLQFTSKYQLVACFFIIAKLKRLIAIGGRV